MNQKLLLVIMATIILLDGCVLFDEAHYEGMDTLVLNDVRYTGVASGDERRCGGIIAITPDGDRVYAIENDNDRNYLLAGSFRSWYLYKKESFNPKHENIVGIYVHGYYDDPELIACIVEIKGREPVVDERIATELDDGSTEIDSKLFMGTTRIIIKYDDDPVGEVFGDTICAYGSYYIYAGHNGLISISEEEYIYLTEYHENN